MSAEQVDAGPREMIRSRTLPSTRPATALDSSARASWSSSPPRSRSGSPSNPRPPLPSRTATTIATGSASSRRATNPSSWSDASSSHWASSTTQTTGRSSATSESSPRTASPTTKRSGGGLRAEPERRLERVTLRGGQALPQIEQRPAQLMQARVGELHLVLVARRADDPAAGCAPSDVLE